MTAPREYFTYLLEGFRRELELQRELLDIARKKRDLLLANDIEALVPLLEREEDLVFQVCGVERRLQHVWGELQKTYFPDAGDLSFSILLDLVDEDLKEEFRTLREELTVVTRELRELNRQNALLIEDILNYIGVVFSLLLRETERQENPYGPLRGNSPGWGVRGVLVDGVV